MNPREYLNKWTPGGSQTRSKRDLFTFPEVVDYADGASVWCGNKEFTDWIAGLASVGLGYQHPAVNEIVGLQLQRGVTFPLPTRLEGEVAEQLIEAIGFGEQVRWVKTGSEATDGAMLIARQATGRRKIVSLGYHGWHLAHLPGPEHVCLPIDCSDYWSHIDGNTAAVLVEPMRDKVIDGDHLRRIQRRCADLGALFILDEIVTGFRWTIGGAGEFFNITPDIACYGKAMANGYPIAAIVGSRKLLQHATGVSSTFGGECVGLAAARATISVYRTEPVIETLWARGKQLIEGVPRLVGYPVHPVFTKDEGIALSAKAAERGHLVHPAGINPMYAHTKQDVESLIEALGGSSTQSPT